VGQAVRVEVLGPLRVWRDRAPVRVTGRRQRLLLSVLVAEHRRTVPVDRLVDALWEEDERPRDPQNTVQQYLAHVRRALDAAPGPTEPTLVTSPPGYRLDLPVGGLDLDEMENLVRRARRALAGGEAADAEGFARRAIDLWAGDPFEEFGSHPFLLAAVDRARSLRREATEVVADVCRATGRSREVLDLLDGDRAWLESESLTLTLVWALATEQRPADALLRAGEHRRAAADRGVEPGPQLRRLVAEVLSHGRARTPLGPVLPVSPEAGALRDLVLSLPAAVSGSASSGREHLAHHLSLTRALNLPTLVADPASWRAELDRHRDGFEASLAWAVTDDPVAGLELALELARFWDWTGDRASLRRWFEDLLAAVGPDDAAPRSDAHGWLAFSWHPDDPARSTAHLVQAEAAARGPDELGRTRAVEAVVRRDSDPGAALAAAEVAIDLLVRHGSPDEAAYAYVVAALAALALGRADTAELHTASAAALYADAHHPSGLAWVDVIEARMTGGTADRASRFERRHGDRSVTAMLDPSGRLNP